MKILPFLLPALLLVACGDPGSSSPAPGDAGGTTAAATGLVARAEPLALGEEAPAFAGLPAGDTTILVFYRGPW